MQAPKRFIVAEGLYDAFLEKFTAAMTASKMGDPFADDTVLGPLSSLAAAERLQEQVDRAVAQGATLVAGGTRNGAFYEPTVLTGVTSQMDVYREELFGPAVYVNLVLADSPELPFGGVKRSGTSREMGLLAADEFVNKKLIRTAP